MLEQNTTKKRQIDENLTNLDVGNNNNRKYKVKAICNNAIYAKELKSGHPPKFYYLVS